MEEYVGLKWHEYITGKASRDFSAATVTLREHSLALGIVFRALGAMRACALHPPHREITTPGETSCRKWRVHISKQSWRGVMVKH